MKALMAAALFAITLPRSMAQSRASEEALYRKLTNETSSVSVSALDQVLKTPGDFSADILYVSCSVALREKRLEDAGFLFYVAPFRAKFDKTLFPPVRTGADDPMLAFAEVKQQLGPALNPTIMAQPKVYARALARVTSWKPKLAARYTPWWEFSKKRTEKEAEEAIAGDRKEFLKHMGSVCTLLQDETYFAAFKTTQDYNLKLPGATDRPSSSLYETALRTMERIEKEKGLEGIASLTKK